MRDAVAYRLGRTQKVPSSLPPTGGADWAGASGLPFRVRACGRTAAPQGGPGPRWPAPRVRSRTSSALARVLTAALAWTVLRADSRFDERWRSLRLTRSRADLVPRPVPDVTRRCRCAVSESGRMELTWYGRTCVRLRGKDAVVVADPFQSVVGPTGRGITGDIVTFSHPDDTPAAARPRARRRATGGRCCRRAWTTHSCSTARASTRSRRCWSPASGPIATTRAAPRPASRSRSRRARRRPHHPPRRHRPPAVRGEARRHRAGRHRLRAARRRAVADPGRGARRAARPADRRPDADLRGRGGLRRGAQALLPRDGRRAGHPAQALGDGVQPARPRRRPSCWSRAASRPDGDRPARRVRPSCGRGRRGRA